MESLRFFILIGTLALALPALARPVIFHCPTCKKVTGTNNSNHCCGGKENCTQQHHIDDPSSCTACQAKSAAAAKAAAEKAQRDSLMTRKNELGRKAADLRRQIADLSSGGKTAELRSKLAKAQALLSEIQSDPELDASDRASLIGAANSKIASLRDSINNIEERKRALIEEAGGVEAEMSRVSEELNKIPSQF